MESWYLIFLIDCNFLKPAMKYAKELGLGFESASFGELSQAINSGVDHQVSFMKSHSHNAENRF